MFEYIFTGSTIGIAIASFLRLVLMSIAGWLTKTWLFRRLLRMGNMVSSITTKPPELRKGLIVLVSPNQIETAKKAITFHYKKLTHLWLIYSDASMEKMKSIDTLYHHDMIGQAKSITSSHIADVNDPMEFYKVISMIYETLPKRGLSDSDVIADYTGMTAHASVGMVLACLHSRERALQFVPAIYDAKGVKETYDPIEIDLNLEMLIRPGNANEAKA